MLVIETYRQLYQFDSNFDYTLRLGSYWDELKNDTVTRENILIWRKTYSNSPVLQYKKLSEINKSETIAFSRNGRVAAYGGVVESDIFEYIEFLSKLIFIRLDELTLPISNRYQYNLNDAIHSLLLDKSYIRDYKLSQLCQ